jgi:hypothetical protein
MINDIKLGKINMVLSKDLSRLGRNYVITGQYTDFFFPENGVRYIAVNDDFDTSNEDNEIAPFKNILNEMYAKDISKKVRSSRRLAALQGKFMGSMPSFGYKRSEEDRHKLVIDARAAEVVKRMFQMFKNHESARSIADMLNREGIPTPQNYYYESLGQENLYKRNAKTWCSSTVISILRKEVYLGHMVQCKRKVVSFKTKKVKDMPAEMWQYVKDTHEAIIDEPTWNAVQLLLLTNKNSNPKKTASGDVSLFSNLVRCKDCNASLTFGSHSMKGVLYKYYRCSRYLQHGTEECTPHRISLDDLSRVVLQDIKSNARLAKEDEDAFIAKLHKINMKEKRGEIEKNKKREALLKKRLSEIDGLMLKVFEKNCAGILSDKMCASISAKYEQEKLALESTLHDLSLDIIRCESEAGNMADEVEKLKQYAEITALNRKILTNLIQSIHISEPRKENGEKVYDIEIRYKFHNNAPTRKDFSAESLYELGAVSNG